MMISKIKGKTLVFKLRALSVILSVLIVALTVTAFAATAADSLYTVDVYENGTVTRVETSKKDAEAILTGLKMEIGENDIVDTDSFIPGEDSSIVVFRYSDISLTTNDGKKVDLGFAGTVGQLLEEQGVTVEKDDIINYPDYTVVTDGMQVVIEKACLVTVRADGEENKVRVGFVTVEDALDKAGVSLGEDDIVSPAANEQVEDGTTVVVERVKFETRTETQKISYSTDTIKSAAFLEGTRQVTTEGVNGEKEVTYIDKYVDGELVESTVDSEEVTKEPVNEVVTVGTKSKIAFTAASTLSGSISELTLPSDIEIVDGIPSSYEKIVMGKAAAYTASSSAKTASGKSVKPGYIAVDPEQFPYGTKLYIVATDGTVYGYAIAADTGGFVNNGSDFTIDLFMNTYDQAINWGVKDVIIYVL